jgi:hypothetical protein
MRRKLLFGSALLIGCLAVGITLYLTGGAGATLAVSPPEDSASLPTPSQRKPLPPSGAQWKPYSVEEVVSIQLSRGPCYGECPVYGLLLRPDGTLKFDGGEFVNRLGGWTAEFDRGRFVDLVNLLNEVKFSTFADEYNSNFTDMSTEVILVTTDSGKKSVSQYGPSAPDGFRRVRDAMDKVMDSATSWIQVTPPPKPLVNSGPPSDAPSSGPPGDRQ